MRGLLVAGLLGLAGCGVVYDENAFLEAYPNEICQRGLACQWPDVIDVGTCAEARRESLLAEVAGCGRFDPAMANDCIAEVRELRCEDTDYASADAHPPSCVATYNCNPLTTTVTTPLTSETGI